MEIRGIRGKESPHRTQIENNQDDEHGKSKEDRGIFNFHTHHKNQSLALAPRKRGPSQRNEFPVPSEGSSGSLLAGGGGGRS